MYKQADEMFRSLYSRFSETGDASGELSLVNESPAEKKSAFQAAKYLEERGLVRDHSTSGYIGLTLTAKGIDFGENDFKEPNPQNVQQHFSGITNSTIYNGDDITVNSNNSISVSLESSALSEEEKVLVNQIIDALKSSDSETVRDKIKRIIEGAGISVASSGLSWLLLHAAQLAQIVP